MFDERLIVQTPTRRGQIYRGLVRTASALDVTTLLVAVSYATEAGCKYLVESFSERVTNWEKVEKRWLVSIDYGITEPKALRYLSRLSNSSVRIPNASAILSQNHFRPKDPFHNKCYIFNYDQADRSGAVVSGSANLTLSGLVSNCEHAISLSWRAPFHGKEKQSWIRSRTSVLELLSYHAGCERLTRTVLRDYESKWRPIVPNATERLIRDLSRFSHLSVTFHSMVTLATSKYFWVKVDYVVPNRGKGLPGNQIDLQRGSRIYFGLSPRDLPPNTPLGRITIRYRNSTAECNMRFGNNLMDKLNLPIPEDGGPKSYDNSYLLFERLGKGEFRLSLGSRSDYYQWRSLSEEGGLHVEMHGGRDYGVFN